MIVIHIITKKEEQLNQIAEWLIKEKLVHGGVDIDYQDTFVINEKEELVRTTTYKLQARTKGLLFNLIEAGLRSNFHEDTPYLYSTPIVNMDRIQSKELTDSTLKI